MNKKKFWLRKISTVTARTFTAKLIVAVIEGTCIFHLSFFNTCKKQCLSQLLSTKLILKVMFLLIFFWVVNMQSIRNTKLSWVEFFRTRAVRYKPGVDI